MSRRGEWEGYIIGDHDFAEFEAGRVVLDVGCGRGVELLALDLREIVAIGFDMDFESLRDCYGKGLRVFQAQAEEMPVRAWGLDGLVCKVVMPYTDEARVLAEIARVLRPGGRGLVCYHGIGYYVRYILFGRSWKRRLYGFRTLVNTWVYATTATRLPGFAGDTIYQSRRRLHRYYRDNHLILLDERPARSFLGLPVFLYHTFRKVG